MYFHAITIHEHNYVRVCDCDKTTTAKRHELSNLKCAKKTLQSNILSFHKFNPRLLIPPLCVPWNESLSLEHVLLYCYGLIEVLRNRFFEEALQIYFPGLHPLTFSRKMNVFNKL